MQDPLVTLKDTQATRAAFLRHTLEDRYLCAMTIYVSYVPEPLSISLRAIMCNSIKLQQL